MTGRPRNDDASQVQRAIVLWDDGMPTTRVAERVGIQPSTLRRRLREAGRDLQVGRRGSRHSSWRGGRRRTSEGYIHVFVDADHPMAAMRGARNSVLEHRLVMACHLGRPLEQHETVHHINGIRDDNRIENLQLRVGHHGQGAAWRCADCGSANVEAVAA